MDGTAKGLLRGPQPPEHIRSDTWWESKACVQESGDDLSTMHCCACPSPLAAARRINARYMIKT